MWRNREIRASFLLRSAFGIYRVITISTKRVGDTNTFALLRRQGQEREVEILGFAFGDPPAFVVRFCQSGWRGR